MAPAPTEAEARECLYRLEARAGLLGESHECCYKHFPTAPQGLSDQLATHWRVLVLQAEFSDVLNEVMSEDVIARLLDNGVDARRRLDKIKDSIAASLKLTRPQPAPKPKPTALAELQNPKPSDSMKGTITANDGLRRRGVAKKDDANSDFVESMDSMMEELKRIVASQQVALKKHNETLKRCAEGCDAPETQGMLEMNAGVRGAVWGTVHDIALEIGMLLSAALMFFMAWFAT